MEIAKGREEAKERNLNENFERPLCAKYNARVNRIGDNKERMDTKVLSPSNLETTLQVEIEKPCSKFLN